MLNVVHEIFKLKLHVAMDFAKSERFCQLPEPRKTKTKIKDKNKN